MVDGDTEATTGLMATTATTERGLLRPSPLLMPLPRLLLIPGTDTTALDTEATMATDTGPMAMDTTTKRGLLRLSPRPLLMLLLRLLLIPGTDTMAMASTMATTAMDTGLMAMDTTDIGLMAMDTTMERGLLMLSLLLMLLLPPRPRLIPGTDTTAMATGLMAMDTTDTGLMATIGERSKECNFCQTAAN